VKRRISLVFVVAALVPAAAALVPAGTALAAARGVTIKLEKTSRGKILTTSRGYTLYMFQRDKRRKDVCVQIPQCTTLWPLVTSKAKPIAGSGVKSRLLGTITLKGGTRQVTYNGWPLYTYIGDSFPRSTQFIGLEQSGGFWWALNAAGRMIK
jgi:predicted lipoprotein with Yx(FWY)xxD motif